MKIDELIDGLENYRGDSSVYSDEAIKIALAVLKAHKQGHHYRDEKGRYVITELDEILNNLGE